MILPRGITGFDAPNRLPEADPRQFREACREAVRPFGGRIDDRPQVFDPGLVSFLALVLVLPGREVAALLNKTHPWLGFCRPLEPGQTRFEFEDGGPVAAGLAAAGGYRVLSVDELVRPVEEAVSNELGPAERHELRYWTRCYGPGRLRVGDVVFNFWD